MFASCPKTIFCPGIGGLKTGAMTAFEHVFFAVINHSDQWSILTRGPTPVQPNRNIPALGQITAWRPPGDKPLSEPMMVSLLTHICVPWLQWLSNPQAQALAYQVFGAYRLPICVFHYKRFCKCEKFKYPVKVCKTLSLLNCRLYRLKQLLRLELKMTELKYKEKVVIVLHFFQ